MLYPVLGVSGGEPQAAGRPHRIIVHRFPLEGPHDIQGALVLHLDVHAPFPGEVIQDKEKVPFDWIVGVLEEFERNGATYKTDNAEYLNYVDKMRKTFWKRKLKNIVIKIKRKIRGK